MNSRTLKLSGFHIQLEYDIYMETANIIKIDSCLFCFCQLDSQPALLMPLSFKDIEVRTFMYINDNIIIQSSMQDSS